MADLAPFIDVEHALMGALADLVTDPADVVTVIPSDLQARIADGRHVIRVRCVGGGDDRISDHPRVDVETFAGTRAVAAPLAETIRQRLISGPQRTSYGVIDRATTEVGPQEIPYDDPDVRRWTATYRLSTRRRVS